MNLLAKRCLALVCFFLICVPLFAVFSPNSKVGALASNTTYEDAFWQNATQFDITKPRSGFPPGILGSFRRDENATSVGNGKLIYYTGEVQVVSPTLRDNNGGTVDVSECQGKGVKYVITIKPQDVNLQPVGVDGVLTVAAGQQPCKNHNVTVGRVTTYLKTILDQGINQYAESFDWQNETTIIARGGIFGAQGVALTVNQASSQIIRECAVSVKIDNVSGDSAAAKLEISGATLGGTPACGSNVVNAHNPGHTIAIAHPEARQHQALGRVFVDYTSDAESDQSKLPKTLEITLKKPDGSEEKRSPNCNPPVKNDKKWVTTCTADFDEQNAGSYTACVVSTNVCSNPQTKEDGKDVRISFSKTQNSTPISQGFGDQNVTCETSGNALTWILCPVFNGVADASDWLFRNFIQPFLYTSPISTDKDNGAFQIWSSFRVYGNIILIVAMLVVIFGTTIGGGLIDAYTAKKVLPRILTAAILINLSVYIVNFLVDITNIIGGGLGELMLAPLKTHHQLSFTPGASTSIPIVFWSGFLGLMLGTGTISGILIGLFTGGGIFLAKAGVYILMVVVIPVVLSLLGVFVTLILRRGLILFLILISPVAFALYALPNTEQFFRKWWKLLFQTLMVYPIIIAIFAIADILSVTIITANNIPADSSLATQVSATSGIGAGKTLALVVAFVLQFLPLVLIPFAFKFAGGAVSALHGVITNGRGKVHGMLQGRRERAQQELRSRTLANRERAYQALGTEAGRRRGLSRWGLRQLQNRVGGYDLYAARAADRAARLKEAEETIATGIDDERRGLTVNKRWAFEHDATGGTHWRRNASGGLEFRSLGGRWLSESDVDQAHARWDGSDSDLQASVAYEMQKAATQEEMDYIHNNFSRLNGRGSGFNMSEAQFGGVWIGAAFQKQNSDRQWKQYAWNGETGQLEVSGVNMMREIDERQGSWQMASQHADTWTTMSEEVNRAARIVAGTATADEQGSMTLDDAREVMQRGARIARSLEGGYTDPVTGEYHSSIGQGASGHTREEMQRFGDLFTEGRLATATAPAIPPGPYAGTYAEETGTARREAIDPATGRPVRSGGPTPGGDVVGGPPVRPPR